MDKHASIAENARILFGKSPNLCLTERDAHAIWSNVNKGASDSHWQSTRRRIHCSCQARVGVVSSSVVLQVHIPWVSDGSCGRIKMRSRAKSHGFDCLAHSTCHIDRMWSRGTLSRQVVCYTSIHHCLVSGGVLSKVVRKRLAIHHPLDCEQHRHCTCDQHRLAA